MHRYVPACALRKIISIFERRKFMKKERKGKIAAGLTVLTVLCTSAKFPVPVQTVHAEEVQLPAETNTSFSKAREIGPGDSVAGTLSGNDSSRYYKFSLQEANRLEIGVECNDRVYVMIYDSTQTEIYETDRSDRTFSIDGLYLTGGDYYMQLKSYYDRDCTFSFIANMDPMGESFTETQDSNNDMSSDASAISLKTKYKGVLAKNDDIDYYKFQSPSAGQITLNIMNSTSGTVKYTVYDGSLSPVYTNTVRSSEKTSQPVSVKSGDYYLVIAKEDVNKGTGSYTFSTDYTKKNTSAPKIKSVKNTSSGTISVKWSRVNGAGGYELWYSTKSNFKSSVTKKETNASVTSTDCYGLSRNKKYYIRIRAYSEINGIREYGKWSRRKSVVIKR